jgi:hypothetical protein
MIGDEPSLGLTAVWLIGGGLPAEGCPRLTLVGYGAAALLVLFERKRDTRRVRDEEDPLYRWVTPPELRVRLSLRFEPAFGWPYFVIGMVIFLMMPLNGGVAIQTC